MHISKRSMSRAGFTLVEFLVYMSLLSIFLVILADIFAAILEVRASSESISSIEQDQRFIIARLAYDINRAASISTPAALGDTSASLTAVIDGVANTYQLGGTNLELTNGLGTNALNGSESLISNLSFQRIGNIAGKPTVKIQFTISSRTQYLGASDVRNANTTVGIR